MPGKGTPIYTVRIPDGLAAEIAETIERRNLWRSRKFFPRPGEPWTLTSFILTAIREKIRKMQRSRTHGGKRKPSAQIVRV